MLFKRTGTNALAKVIRNASIARTSKTALVRELNKLFKKDNPLFDEDQFRQLCSGKLDKDPLYGWREKDE
jgi:hypothetical protein